MRSTICSMIERFKENRGDIVQPTCDIDHLVRQAQMARSMVQKYARCLTLTIGLDPDNDLEIGPIKQSSRIAEKASDKFHGHPERVLDISRARLSVRSADDIRQLRSIVGPGAKSHPFHDKWERRGVHLLSLTDHFLNPKAHGYVGIDMKIGIVGNHSYPYHVAELQVVHGGMAQALKISREIYELMRPYTDKQKAGVQLEENEQLTLDGYMLANKALFEAEMRRLELTDLVAPNDTVFEFDRAVPFTNPVLAQLNYQAA